MRFKTIRDGLADIINDFIEGDLDPATAGMFTKYLHENESLASFVERSKKGRMALKKAYDVVAADDFEEKLAARIQGLKE